MVSDSLKNTAADAIRSHTDRTPALTDRVAIDGTWEYQATSSGSILAGRRSFAADHPTLRNHVQ